MSREYSENVLVQNSAGNLLQNVLGWEVKLHGKNCLSTLKTGIENG